MLNFCGCFYGSSDARICRTTANIATHKSVNIGIRGLRIVFQKCCCTHNLPRLAVATLGNIVFQPCFLNRVVTLFRKPFYGCNRLIFNCRHGELTRPNRISVQMNGASTASCNTAAVFRSLQIEVVAQNPKHRRCGISIHLPIFSVDF